MGRSAGPGSPLFFRCPKLRSEYPYGKTSTRDHEVALTGRTKPYRGGKTTGQRSTPVSREYRCACGHVGWSNHADLVYLEES